MALAIQNLYGPGAVCLPPTPMDTRIFLTWRSAIGGRTVLHTSTSHHITPKSKPPGFVGVRAGRLVRFFEAQRGAHLVGIFP